MKVLLASICMLSSALASSAFASTKIIHPYNLNKQEQPKLNYVDIVLDHYNGLIEFDEENLNSSSIFDKNRTYEGNKKLIKEQSLSNSAYFAELISIGIGEVITGEHNKYNFSGVSDELYATREQYEKASKIFEFIGYNHPFYVEEILTRATGGKNFTFVEKFILDGRKEYEEESKLYKKKNRLHEL